MSGKQSEQKVYLVGRVSVAEGDDSPGSSGVVLVACDAPQPQSYGFRRHFFWMDPSGVVRSGIQPHRVIAGLERLDASTEEHFQQVQAGNAIIDELDHSVHQHPRLHGLFSGYFQWSRGLNMVKREVGKTS